MSCVRGYPPIPEGSTEAGHEGVGAEARIDGEDVDVVQVTAAKEKRSSVRDREWRTINLRIRTQNDKSDKQNLPVM